MARQKLGPKKVNKLRETTGLDIVFALTRGGTNHRIDLHLKNGDVYHLHKTGRFERELVKAINS